MWGRVAPEKMDTHPFPHTFYCWVSFGKAMKICTKCKIQLPIAEFYKNKSRTDGLQKWCKSCCKLRDASRVRTYDAKVQARYKEQRNISYLKNRDGDKRRNASKLHYLLNKETYKVRAIARANKLSKSLLFKNDLSAIAKVYKLAKKLRAQGFAVEVDHIVPLNGKTVSGLHVSWNLQILLASENRTKSNKF